MPTIVFHPSNLRFSCQPGEDIFSVAQKHDLKIRTACVGKGTCGLCKVRIIAGEENLSPYNPLEEKHLGNTYFITKNRLSCQALVQKGTVEVEIPTIKSPKK